MNIDYLEAAKERIPNIPLLINMVSRRVRQLSMGQRPMVKPDHPHQENLDVALKEVAAGLLEAEVVWQKEGEVADDDSFLSLSE